MQVTVIVIMIIGVDHWLFGIAPSGADLFGPRFLQRYCLSEAAWALCYDLQ